LKSFISIGNYISFDLGFLILKWWLPCLLAYLLVFSFGAISIFIFSPLFLWMVLELSFIVMFILFLVDSFRSSIIVFLIIELIFSILFFYWCLFGWVFLLSLVLIGKFGIFPFWFWVIRLFEDYSLQLCIFLIGIYKICLFVLLVYSFGFPVFFILIINFFSGLIIFVQIFNLSILFSFFSIFSVGWLLLFGFSEVFLVYLIYYFIALFFFFLSYINERFLSFYLFGWGLFYMGFPFFLSFFLKLIGLYDVSHRWLISLLMFFGSVIFLCVFFLLSLERLLFISGRVLLLPVLFIYMY